MIHLIVLGSGLLYLLAIGVTWSLVEESRALKPSYSYDADARYIASAFWPITLVVYILIWIAQLGMYIPPWLVDKWRDRKATKLPRAYLHDE